MSEHEERALTFARIADANTYTEHQDLVCA